MIYHIGNLNSESQRISQQMASGKAIDKGSEDSMLHARLIGLDDKLRVTEGMKLQITKSQALNETADQTISEMKMAIESVKLDLMKSLNDGMDRSDKLALATNLKSIREDLIDKVNIEVDGEHLFTGSDTTIEPLKKDDDFKVNGRVDFMGDAFLRKIAVQPGSYRDRGTTAHEIIYYNADTSGVAKDYELSNGTTLTKPEGAVSFKSREIVIDEEGHTWQPDYSDIANSKLVKLDNNGVPTNEYLKITNIVYDPKEFQIKRTVAEDDKFSMTFTDEFGNTNGVPYSYTAVAGDDAESVAQQLVLQMQADIGNPPLSNIFSGAGQISTDGDGNIVYDNDNGVFSVELDVTNAVTNSTEAIFALPEARMVTETISDARSGGRISENTRSGLLLEAKHSYFDDLNIMINALEGYETISLENDTYNGQKGEIISDSEVDLILKDQLGVTTGQYDATNVGHGELGGRNKVFELAFEKLETQSTHYNILIQEYGGADMAKLAMESKSLELTYQALYSTISKMNQLSLVNFLN
jgi:flagellin-like hook-associated protein FlgL